MGNDINTNTIYSTNSYKPIKLKEYSLEKGVADICEIISGNGVISNGLSAKFATGTAKLAETAPVVAKSAGKLSFALSTAYGAYETYEAYQSGGTSAAIKKGTAVTGGIVMSVSCAKVGAMVGSFAGPGGAVAGAFIGGVFGYLAGEKVVELVQYIHE